MTLDMIWLAVVGMAALACFALFGWNWLCRQRPDRSQRNSH